MSMGKGLNAILKAPGGLKRAESDEVATAQVATEEVTTKDKTVEVATAKIHTGEVITDEEDTAVVATEGVTTTEVITDRVDTDGVATTQVTMGGVTINQAVIAKAISDAKRSPRISTWSPVAMGTLKSLWMTQPQFSMSNEIRTLIEEGLAKKYPELVEMVKRELEKS